MTDKFNENLKKARQNANMTQEEVAVKIGVAKNTYCNWELGKREPDIMKIKALARLFGVSVDYLVGMEENTVVYDFKANNRTNRKSPAKRQIERSTGYSTAGSGGRTRTRAACIRTYSGIVPKCVPNQQKKSGASAPPM